MRRRCYRQVLFVQVSSYLNTVDDVSSACSRWSLYIIFISFSSCWCTMHSSSIWRPSRQLILSQTGRCVPWQHGYSALPSLSARQDCRRVRRRSRRLSSEVFRRLVQHIRRQHGRLFSRGDRVILCWRRWQQQQWQWVTVLQQRLHSQLFTGRLRQETYVNRCHVTC